MHNVVQDYYGKVLSGSQDLQTNACCTDDDLSPSVKRILSNIHDEVMTRYYGCGLVTPQLLEGAHVLDLGCGAGRDCYAIAQMVGEHGSVIGVDMTDEQLAVANKHVEYHREKFGYKQANTTFLKGYIEKLDQLSIADNSIDVVISNCVINLSPDKHAVLKEVFRILKPGGEIYFSDVYADKRVPEILKDDALLYGECLSGALYWNDFENLAKSVGFVQPRLFDSRAITIDNDELASRVGDIQFTSATYRLFKSEGLETSAQNYGQTATYLGTIEHHEQSCTLDQHCHFVTGDVTPISGNTFHTLSQSRFAAHFKFDGDLEKHLGLFEQNEHDFDFVENNCVENNCVENNCVENNCVENNSVESNQSNQSTGCCAPKVQTKAQTKSGCC